MINKIQEEIDAINNNLSILPTDTNKKKEEYVAYIDSQLKVYNAKLKEIADEIEDRYHTYRKKYSNDSNPKTSSKIDVSSVKFTSDYLESYERMNLPYYIYEIGHYYKEDLNKINKIILYIIAAFEKVSIKLTIQDFNYTEVVNKYMAALLNKDDDMHTVFESLYWENSNLMNQIELNFRYLYFKYKKKIDAFFKNNVASSKELLEKYKQDNEYIDYCKHNNIKYLSSQVLGKNVSVTEISRKSIESIATELLLTDDREANYNNLLKLNDTLLEYKELLHFMFVIDDFKKLFEHKQEYKDVYNNKYKEIVKKEKELFKLNKKLNSRFANGETKLNRNNCLIELYKLYHELDDLKIQNTIFKDVNNDTTYHELLLIVTADFNYFVKLLKAENDNLTMKDIDENIIRLFRFVYCGELNIINNISISEDKNIPQIISDRYRLININLKEDKITLESIDSYLKNINNLVMHYDFVRNRISLDELEFIIYVENILRK